MEVVSIFINPNNLSMKLLRFLFFSFFSYLPFVGLAQESIARLDSLERTLKNKLSDQDRFTILDRLFNHYRLTNYQKALGFANQSYSIALAMGDSNKIVLSGRHQSYVLIQLGKNKEVIEVLTKLLIIAERNKERSMDLKKQIKPILNNIGIAYGYIGKYDKALEYHFKSLAIRQEEGDKKSIANTLSNIGVVFYTLEDYKKALEYYLKVLEIKKEIGDSVNFDKVLINIGLCYNQLNEFKIGIDYFNQGLDFFGKDCSEDIRRDGLLGLGFAYVGIKNSSKAEDCILKSLAISKTQNNPLYQLANLFQLSQIEILRGNNQKALGYLEDAKAFAEKSDFTKESIQLYEELAKTYNRIFDYKHSLFYLYKYVSLKDSVYSSELAKNLTKVQTEYAERENQKTIASQKQILALNAELINRQKQQTIFIAVIALLLLLLAGVFYKNYRDKLIANRRLDEKVKERTEELRHSHQSLDKSFGLQQLTMQQVWQEGQSILSSIKGLCHLALLDLQEAKAKEYVAKVDDNTGQLTALLAKLTSVMST
jgi:tetratricopeptide (TPR) repeat protein